MDYGLFVYFGFVIIITTEKMTQPERFANPADGGGIGELFLEKCAYINELAAMLICYLTSNYYNETEGKLIEY